jgi:site-specific DNA recombinase
MERLLTTCREDLLSFDELRARMSALRQREQATRAELESLTTQTAEREAYLRLAETLTAFLERLRSNAQTLDIGERQSILRLLIKEVIVGKDTITIRHSLAGHLGSSGGSPGPSKAATESKTEHPAKSYLLCLWRALADSRQRVYALRPRPLVRVGGKESATRRRHDVPVCG